MYMYMCVYIYVHVKYFYIIDKNTAIQTALEFT